MALGIASTQTYDRRKAALTQRQTVDAATQVTAPVKAFGGITAQITGAATAINGFVERSSVPPTNDDTGAGGVWSPVGAALSGAPSAGSVVPINYAFSGTAWYRFRVVSITGVAEVALSAGE